MTRSLERSRAIRDCNGNAEALIEMTSSNPRAMSERSWPVCNCLHTAVVTSL
jgi:hypothetical protein